MIHILRHAHAEIDDGQPDDGPQAHDFPPIPVRKPAPDRRKDGQCNKIHGEDDTGPTRHFTRIFHAQRPDIQRQHGSQLAHAQRCDKRRQRTDINVTFPPFHTASTSRNLINNKKEFLYLNYITVTFLCVCMIAILMKKHRTFHRRNCPVFFIVSFSNHFFAGSFFCGSIGDTWNATTFGEPFSSTNETKILANLSLDTVPKYTSSSTPL